MVVIAKMVITADHPELVTPNHDTVGMARFELRVEMFQFLSPGHSVWSGPHFICR